jgi:hypothetical protein
MAARRRSRKRPLALSISPRKTPTPREQQTPQPFPRRTGAARRNPAPDHPDTPDGPSSRTTPTAPHPSQTGVSGRLQDDAPAIGTSPCQSHPERRPHPGRTRHHRPPRAGQVRLGATRPRTILTRLMALPPGPPRPLHTRITPACLADCKTTLPQAAPRPANLTQKDAHTPGAPDTTALPAPDRCGSVQPGPGPPCHA